MSMVLCRECGCEFRDDEAGRKYDCGEFWGAPYTEDYICCPECESDDITDRYFHCDRCGEPCTYYEETDDGEHICEECYKDFCKDRSQLDK